MGLHYQLNGIPSNFYVIGCGGTGSRIVAMLAQLVASTPWVMRAQPVIYLFDDDIVEEKNLARQLFTKADVGKPKAQVLADRYSKVYGVQIIPILRRVQTEADIIVPVRGTFYQKLAPKPPIECLMPAIIDMTRPSLAFLAVDSAEARRCIIAALAHMYFPYNIVCIDPGNEDTFGQVNVFNVISEQLYTPKLGYAQQFNGWVDAIPERHLHAFPLHLIPLPLTRYLTAEDTVGTGSCASLDQTLALNAMMATACINIAQNIMYNNPTVVRTAYFSIDQSANRSEVLTLPWLKSVCKAENTDYINWQYLYDWLQVDPAIYDLDKFRDDFMLSPCAHEYMAHAYRRELTPGQIQLLRNVINYPVINLEEFTPNRLAELHQQKINEALAVETAALSVASGEVAA